MKYDIIIVGGGLAGLFNALLTARAGFSVCLIEKKSYPMHRVCGEYISNESIPFIEKCGIDLQLHGASTINKVEISSVSGKIINRPLALGGMGFSRYRLDELVYQQALQAGARVMTNTRAERVEYSGGQFRVHTGNDYISGSLVIGSFGKRSNMDQAMGRSFFYRRSPYVGIKYHISGNFDPNTIRLDHFEGGYCGLVKVERESYCLCYLVHRNLLKAAGSIPVLERSVLYRNPHLEKVFEQADFLFEKPEVINEISFAKKKALDQKVFMSGDTAGMITPVCGNGMSMAIHSAKILSELIGTHASPGGISASVRDRIGSHYEREWNRLFSSRMWVGRQVQYLLGGACSGLLIDSLNRAPALADMLISKTHGKVF